MLCSSGIVPCSVAADDVEADHADDVNCFFLETQAVQVFIGVLSRIKAVVTNTATYGHTYGHICGHVYGHIYIYMAIYMAI